jgi:hypothetical protein
MDIATFKKRGEQVLYQKVGKIQLVEELIQEMWL